MRYLLQRILTGEWLTRDFELIEGQRTRALSGPGGINGFVRPGAENLIADDGNPLLWDWGTAIYAEGPDGQIRNNGIVEKISYDDQGRLTLEAPGFSRYAQGIPYSHTYRGVHVDPLATVVPLLWADVQSNPWRLSGVTLDAVTTPESAWIGDNENPYLLAWYNSVDCGAEIDNLAKQVPFDYAELCWYPDGTHLTVQRHIKIGYPRLGRRRTDLRFAGGENIVSVVPVEVDGGEYADELYGIGRGEGSAMVHATVARRQGRLSRPKIITDKTADQARLNAILQAELIKRADVQDISEVTIRDHPNAPISAIDPGDDILIQAVVQGLGSVRLWVRVLSIGEADTHDGQAVLATQRSDSFIYNASTEVS
jgi:hypothetical protein